MFEKLRLWLGNEELAKLLSSQFSSLKDRVVQLEAVGKADVSAMVKPLENTVQALEHRVSSVELKVNAAGGDVAQAPTQTPPVESAAAAAEK